MQAPNVRAGAAAGDGAGAGDDTSSFRQAGPSRPAAKGFRSNAGIMQINPINDHAMAAAAVPRLQIVSRIAAGVVGGYAFTWGFVALSIALLFAARLEFHDAEALGTITGFLVFLTVFLWAFAAASVARAWAVLVVGGALMAGAASLVQRALL